MRSFPLYPCHFIGLYVSGDIGRRIIIQPQNWGDRGRRNKSLHSDGVRLPYSQPTQFWFFTWLDFLAPFADAATSQLLEHKGGERDYQHRKPGEVVEDKAGDFQREVWLAF